jgi:hypothetical protein
MAWRNGMVRSGIGDELRDGPCAARLSLGLSGQWRTMPEKTGFFVDTVANGLYMSRFDKDYLGTASRGPAMSGHVQLYLTGNLTVDAKRQIWAISRKRARECACPARCCRNRSGSPSIGSMRSI